MTKKNLNSPAHCVGCLFQRKHRGTQLGCLCSYSPWERAEKKEDGGNTVLVDRFCQYKRLDGWHPELSLSQQVEQARRDAQISWTLAYKPDGLPINRELKHIERLKESAVAPKKTLCVVKKFEKVLIQAFPTIDFLMIYDREEDFLCQHHSNHFMCVTSKPTDISLDFFSKLDKEINEGDLTFSLMESPHTRLFSGRLWHRGEEVLPYLDGVRKNGQFFVQRDSFK